MKGCKYNDAHGDYRKEGICYKDELELHVAEYDYNNFPYCAEYTAKYWPE